MKQYIILATALVFVFILNYMQISFLKDTAQELENILDEMNSSILEEDYDKSEKEFGKLKERWEEVRQKWDILTEHDDVEAVESHLASLQAYLIQKEQSECINEVYVLSQRFKHITESESISLATVF